MNEREKTLAAAVATLIILWGATQGWSKFQSARARNLSTQQTVAQQLSSARTATERGRRARQKLHKWRKQSLPTDADIAKSLYQDWLQQQLTSAGIQVKQLNVRDARASSQHFQQFSFEVQASGKLEQLTEFLFEFYQAAHLPRISKATFTPTDNRKSLTIALTVDALSLAEANRADALAQGTNDSLTHSLKDFQKSIAGRNLFATYQPPKTEVSPETTAKVETEDAEAGQARLSGFNYGGDGWQMSVRMEKTGKIFYYREGDTIEIGRFKGTIERLDGKRRRVIVAAGGKRLQVELGETLADARPAGPNRS